MYILHHYSCLKYTPKSSWRQPCEMSVMFLFFEGGKNLQAQEALCSPPQLYIYRIYCCFVDWHRFDTYLDSIFHFDADSDPDPDPSPSFTYVEPHKKYILTFNCGNVSLHCFYLFRQFHICHYFQYFGQYIGIFRGKSSFGSKWIQNRIRLGRPWDGILERHYYSRFLGINSSFPLLRLVFLSGFLPSICPFYRCYSRIDPFFEWLFKTRLESG